MRSRSRLPREVVALAGWWFGRRVKNSAGLVPRSANCACMSSFERRSPRGRRNWNVRSGYSASTELHPFSLGSMHK